MRSSYDAGEHLPGVRSVTSALAAADLAGDDGGADGVFGAPVGGVDRRVPEEGEHGRELRVEMRGEPLGVVERWGRGDETTEAGEQAAAGRGQTAVGHSAVVTAVAQREPRLEDRFHLNGPAAAWMVVPKVLAAPEQVGQAGLVQRVTETAIRRPPVAHEHPVEVGGEGLTVTAGGLAWSRRTRPGGASAPSGTGCGRSPPLNHVRSRCATFASGTPRCVCISTTKATTPGTELRASRSQRIGGLQLHGLEPKHRKTATTAARTRRPFPWLAGPLPPGYSSRGTSRSAPRRSPPGDSACVPCATDTSPASRNRRPSNRQCAAVSTHDGWISEPPQPWRHRPPRSTCNRFCGRPRCDISRHAVRDLEDARKVPRLVHSDMQLDHVALLVGCAGGHHFPEEAHAVQARVPAGHDVRAGDLLEAIALCVGQITRLSRAGYAGRSGILNPRYVPPLIPWSASKVALNSGIDNRLQTE